ncbi:hypothetical protein L596_012953 [Steinernema carpocapsae]|uniref:EF-hand domain-containing protein n=1 Tax=Steinernema carpocapsae TaxID=34508 RepID=A0A4U5NYS1_STECR|nr:hypothetical protein L596_012953 [Steinernema carpocapsae]
MAPLSRFLPTFFCVFLACTVSQHHPAGTQEFGGKQAYDAEHIKEHLDGKVDPTVNMTKEQLEFYYFNMYDQDRNGRLDGIELLKAITHYHEHAHESSPGNPPPPVPADTELEPLVDKVLVENDLNADGVVDYSEFIRAQNIREEKAKRG